MCVDRNILFSGWQCLCDRLPANGLGLSHLHMAGSVVMILVALIWKEVRNLSMLCTCIYSQMLSVCLSSCCCNHDIQPAIRCLHCAQVCSVYTRCCGWSLHHPTDLCARYRSALTVQLFAGQVKILLSISTKRGWRGVWVEMSAAHML